MKIVRRIGWILAVLIVVRVLIGLFVPSLNINDVTTGATPSIPTSSRSASHSRPRRCSTPPRPSRTPPRAGR